MFGWKKREANISASLRGTFIETSKAIRTSTFRDYPHADGMEIDIFVVIAMTTFILKWSDQRGKVPTVEADRFCGEMVSALASASRKSLADLTKVLQDRFREYRPFIDRSFQTAEGDGGEFLVLALDKNTLVDIPEDGAARGIILENIITHTAAAVKAAYAR